MSTDFLASDFIQAEELPRLLEQSEGNGLTLHPVMVQPCDASGTPIEQIQFVNMSKPLSKLSKPEQEEVWIKLTKELKEKFAVK